MVDYKDLIRSKELKKLIEFAMKNKQVDDWFIALGKKYSIEIKQVK